MPNLISAPYLSQSLEERAIWGRNFATNLANLSLVGVTPAIVADIESGTDWEFYAAVTRPAYNAVYEKGYTDWKHQIDTDAAPELIKEPLYNPPDAPAVTSSQTGVFNRIVALVRDVILPTNPDATTKTLLGINPIPPKTKAKLLISKMTASPNGHVSMSLSRVKIKLFQVESMRGDATTFSLLDKTTERVVLDERPNLVPGVRESRTYRYKDANDPNGQYSPEASISTQE